MNGKRMTLPVLGLVLAIGAYAFTFVVYQWELALKLRLGEIIDADYKPGLHLMVPGLHNVVKFDGRIQTLDAQPQRFLTIEKKDVIVDSYVKWRISDVAQYFRTTGGSLAQTSRLLSERINTSLRDEFGKRTIQDVVSGERTEIMDLLRKDSDEKASEIGVEVVDVRVKQIDLPPEVSDSVYNRMRAERERVARDLRAQGAEAAEKIRANADRQRTVLLAKAYGESERLRGEGDSKATEIYAKAFNRNPEFYAFYRSLDAYRKAFSSGKDVMVLKPDSDFFRYFSDKNGPATPSAQP
ncbi:MAG: protease modulator HflC [Gammaproteobacteria bacterium]|nr:protease modulator HflC [Gammaproteobacteria bacterium]MBU1653636.1 protease modulator HflC [Gammaproteobacteria bacterium]MBU1962748.1 protease modulator HflC [Gammaproteobacteria bacterium]